MRARRPAGTCIRALTTDDCFALFPEPPQCAAEPVERLRRVGGLERVFERIARDYPVAARKRLIAFREALARVDDRSAHEW